jgi:hypothetical protein
MTSSSTMDSNLPDHSLRNAPVKIGDMRTSGSDPAPVAWPAISVRLTAIFEVTEARPSATAGL